MAAKNAFQLTPKQAEAQEIMAGLATHIMLFGGSRSGKTFLLVRAVCYRALQAPKSRHAILRFRYNHCRASIVSDTFPRVMSLCFPDVPYQLNQTDGFATMPNGSQIWFGGLDDAHRVEKILGTEYATIYLNECSQIPYHSRNIVVTRLSQMCSRDNGTPLKPRLYYDCNPPSKMHWTYRLFVEKRDPETKQPLMAADNYASFRINPADNQANLAPDYLAMLQSLAPHMQRRFLHGEFADATANSLFPADAIDKWRVLDGKVPDMVRIVIGVDPSGAGETENQDNDAVGIVVVGVGTDGTGYVLEDCTVLAGPATWGRVVASAYERHSADIVVGESNYGGAMVQHVIQTARPNTPYRAVTATRGKVVRAEPFCPLYEQGRVRHVGYLAELEDELTAFTTAGYQGDGSPNRADAAIWALTELFRGMVQPRQMSASYTLPIYSPSVAGMGY